MVIDTSVDKLAPLIPKAKDDEMAKVNANYESFMYYCNDLSNLINDCSLSNNNLLLDLPIIHSHLESLYTFASIIKDNVSPALNNNSDSMGKIKLISFNITNKCEEISLKFKKMAQSFSSSNLNRELAEIEEKLNQIHNFTKDINHSVSKEILKLTHSTYVFKEERIIPERRIIGEDYASQQNEIGNFIAAICIGLFFVVIGIVSYIKVAGG